MVVGVWSSIFWEESLVQALYIILSCFNVFFFLVSFCVYFNFLFCLFGHGHLAGA
jgi:hypothetical protein